jgi:hypothetical protein
MFQLNILRQQLSSFLIECWTISYKTMHNATWGESKQEDTMYKTSLFSTAQTIHQNRERLFLELLRPSTSSETLSSPKASDLPSIPNQEAYNNYDTL